MLWKQETEYNKKLKKSLEQIYFFVKITCSIKDEIKFKSNYLQ